MPELRKYHLFISHAWKYCDDYLRLEELLKADSNFSFINYSVPKHNPLIDPNTPMGKKDLETMLSEQIRYASIVLIISDMYAAYKEWIQYEIIRSAYMHKPILGVGPWGQETIPIAVTGVAAAMVEWNTSSIVKAIRKFSAPR